MQVLSLSLHATQDSTSAWLRPKDSNTAGAKSSAAHGASSKLEALLCLTGVLCFAFMIVFDGCLMLCIYDALPFVHVPGVYNAHYSNEYLCLQAAVFHLAAPLGACTHTRTNTCTHIHTHTYAHARAHTHAFVYFCTVTAAPCGEQTGGSKGGHVGGGGDVGVGLGAGGVGSGGGFGGGLGVFGCVSEPPSADCCVAGA